MNLLRRFALLIVLTTLCGDVLSQELQPRRWAALPVGVNFVALGTLWTWGDILFDPALLIEDAEVEILGVGAGYLRTFEMFGKQARIDVGLPYANGRWNGLLDGVPTAVRRHGFGDLQLRLSANLLGPDPLKMREFAQSAAQNPVYTTFGAALGVTVPTGEYRSDRLINLGDNRWVLRPELGVLHQRNNWQFEVTGAVFLFGDNDEFFRGTVRKQDPLWFVQGHAIYTFRPGLWAGLSGGYAMGSRSEINGDFKLDDSRIRYWKVTVGVPINRRQGLSFAFASGRTNTLNDSDLDRVTVNWSLMFGK